MISTVCMFQASLCSYTCVVLRHHVNRISNEILLSPIRVISIERNISALVPKQLARQKYVTGINTID